MSDLNARITEILSDAFAEMGVLDLRSVADVLIRELQLREENGWFGPTNIPKHRYVTDWEGDE